MNLIETPKTYTGHDLETIFFRPMLTGESAEELGIRILYNMPTPTTIQLWDSPGNVLQKYTEAGWTGGSSATKGQKTIRLERVKAELGFSAADYFSLVYELIAGRADVNLDDLTGTELEQAETELFRRAIAESIRATMWIGDTESDGALNCFDGFMTLCTRLGTEGACPEYGYEQALMENEDAGYMLLDKLWENAGEELKHLKREGQLAYFVTSDIYESYERYLDSKGVESAYSGMTNGRQGLYYRGIPIYDIHMGTYLMKSDLPSSMGLLTDRRNLALAVNTNEFPGTEVRMWYNPDLMENRQRAVFMAGCEVVDERLVSFCRVY